MVLKNLFGHLIQPFLKESRLPEPGEMIRIVCASQVLHSTVLSVGRIRTKCGRRTRTEVMRGIEHPGLPRAGERRHWRGATPNAGRRRKGSRENLIRSIGLSIGNHGMPDALP